MAPASEELFTHFQFHAPSGGFIEPGQSGEFVRSLHEITNGRLDMAGANIVDPATRRFIGRIANVSGASLDVGTAGTVLLNNNVPKSRLADAMGGDAIPRALIQGNLGVFGEAFPEDVNRTITLAPRGQVIYVDSTKLPGRSAYSRVRSAVFGEQGAPKSNQLGTLATSEELLVRGVAGWLSRNAPAAIERLKLDGFELPDGTVTVSGSDIVRAIAANISVQPVVTYVLIEGE